MSKAEIYYFSGTGNSLAVARDVARELNADLIPVAALMNQESIHSGADVIGFVFPIYDFKPPQIITSFVPKLVNIDSKYLFAICTYGIAPSRSLEHLNQTIKSCGGVLSGGFAVGMPHNGIGSGLMTKAQHERMYMNWGAKLADVSQYISSRSKAIIESRSLVSDLFRPEFLRMVPSVIKFLMHIALKGIHSLALTANENCTGCETCRRICPVDNIEILADKPSWSGPCTNCFACLHWCPKRAISLGRVDLDIKSYHHPDVNISDMILRGLKTRS